jgi:hypothetical protein
MDPKARASIDEPTMVLAGALPLAMRPDAKTVANIGLGSGLTTHTLLGSATVQDLDTIEIERMMVEGAKLFDPLNRRAFADPRSHIHIEDAKTFFAARNKRYDIIVSEPSNPWVSGVSTLFSEEFYGNVKRYMAPNGLLVQWVQAYEINVGLLSSIFLALGKNFEDYAVFTGGKSGDLFIVATPQGRLPELKADLFAQAGVAADLQRLGFRELSDLQALRVGGRAALEPLFKQAGFPANSDYFPVIDQRAPRSRFKNESAEDLRRLREAPAPVLAMLDSEARTPLARVQRVDPDRPVRLDQAEVAAQSIGVYLSGAAEQATALSPEQKRTALLAKTLQEDCAGAGTTWLEAITTLARLATPVLAREDVAVLFDKAQASRCARTLDEAGRDRLRLLKAINDRDAEAMVQIATRLLEGPARGPAAERGYYLMAAMSGHLAKGRRDDARVLAEKHFASLSIADRDGLPMRLLIAHAFSRPAGRNP